MPEIDKTHERAKFARENAGLSIKQAAQLAELRSRWLEAFEKGEAATHNETLVCLANIYKVSRDWLIFGTARRLPESELQMVNKLPKANQLLMLNILESLPTEVLAKPPVEALPIISGD